MRAFIIDVDLENANLTGIAAAASSAGTSVALAGSLTSGGVFTSADGLGRIITIKDESADTQTDVTFTLVGTDAQGDAISDVITGPASGATVVSSKFFNTLSSVTVSAAQAGTETVDIGTRGTTLAAVSKVYPINSLDQIPAMVSVNVTGTLNFTVQQTYDDLINNKDSSGVIRWEDITALTSKSADTTAQIGLGARGLRVQVNTYSTGAELQATVISVNSGGN